MSNFSGTGKTVYVNKNMPILRSIKIVKKYYEGGK